MTAWAHHLATRWTEAFRSPKNWSTALFAAYMLTTSPFNSPYGATSVGGTFGRVFVAMTLFITSWFVAMSGAGTASGRPPVAFFAARNETRDVGHPTLPLGPDARALAEALAGLGVMAVWQTVFVVILSVPPLAQMIFVREDGFNSLSGTLAIWCAIVPVAVAWLLPAQSKVITVLRGGVVLILANAAFVISFSSLPWAIDLDVALIAALLATARVAMIPGPFTRLVRRSDARTSGGPQHREGGSLAERRAVMYRQSRTPLAQLWRDAVFGPLRASKVVLIACGASFILLGALHQTKLHSEMLASFVVTMVTMVVGTWLAMFALGTPMTTAGGRVHAGRFGGSIGLAWTSLPLRREWVMRVFYLHGIATGLVFVGLSLLGAKITGEPPIFVGGFSGESFSWFPLLCAVPAFAGMMTCSAAGDRVRGFVSTASLFLVVTALPYNSTALAGTFALVGGLPPLVHLLNASKRPSSGTAAL